jgi:hypothetical protein
MVRASN